MYICFIVLTLEDRYLDTIFQLCSVRENDICEVQGNASTLRKVS